MTNDEALTLEALKYAASMGHGRMVREMKIAPFTIKEAQAQPEQEPVAIELALAGLVEKITGGFDSGDLLADAVTASKMLDAQPKQPISVQPVQEPVAWITPDGEGFRIRFSPPTSDVPLGWDALYTTPPERPWVDLSDSQIEQVYYDVAKLHRGAPMPWGQVQFGNALQALVKEKNA